MTPSAVTVGADADLLAVAGRRFAEGAVALERHRLRVGDAFAAVAWSGLDAEASRRHWFADGAPALARSARFLERLADVLAGHAAEQRHASQATQAASGRPVAGHARPIDDLRSALAKRFPWLAADEPATLGPPPVVLAGARPERFTAAADGRDTVLAALGSIARPDRIRFDEIEIRALDNGRFVVVLPGVTDLSAELGAFVDRVRDGLQHAPEAAVDAAGRWTDNDAPTARKMRYAYEAARADDTDHNEYAAAVVAAMRAAGVPAGSEVLLVGHSFGAYAAVDLAADAVFNARADPFERSGAYSVAVTHVVAAGAEVDWRFDELPAGTHALVLNNRLDLVYRTEDLLHRDADPAHPHHLEQVFWGGTAGWGHDESNYVDWLRDATDRDDLAGWLDHLGRHYAAAGTGVTVPVPDLRGNVRTETGIGTGTTS